MPQNRTSPRRASLANRHHFASYYDVVECRQIVAAASQIILDEKLKFPFSYLAGLLLYTGMPLEEILTLRWEASANHKERWPWLDLKTWQIAVPPAANGKRRVRFVPIIPQVGRLLMHWPCAKAGRLLPFPVTTAQVEQRWNETIKLAQVKYIACHALRDTYITLMREAGLSLDEIIEALPPPAKRKPAVRVMS